MCSPTYDSYIPWTLGYLVPRFQCMWWYWDDILWHLHHIQKNTSPIISLNIQAHYINILRIYSPFLWQVGSREMDQTPGIGPYWARCPIFTEPSLGSESCFWALPLCWGTRLRGWQTGCPGVQNAHLMTPKEWKIESNVVQMSSKCHPNVSHIP